MEYQPENLPAEGAGDQQQAHGLTCVSWNECPFEPFKLAVGGYSKRAVVLSIQGNTLKEVLSVSMRLYLI